VVAVLTLRCCRAVLAGDALKVLAVLGIVFGDWLQTILGSDHDAVNCHLLTIFQ